MKSKLISLLQTFNNREIDRLQKLVDSPFFNTNAEVQHLFSYLKQYFPEFPAEPLSDEMLFKVLYPEEQLNKKKLSYIKTDLLRLTEKFLGLQQLEKDELLLESQIVSALVDRQQDKSYKYHYQNIKNRLAQQTGKNKAAYYYAYLFADIATEHFSTKEVHAFDQNLQQASNALDDFYFIQKLKYSCEMLNRQAILTDEFSLPFMEEVKNYLLEKEDLPVLIEIYLQIYFSLLHPDKDQYVEALLQLIQHHAVELERKERRDVYLYALNLCVRKLRQGKSEYLAITLDIYKEGIANKALLDKGQLSHWTYNNIVKLAIRLEEYDWVERFIRRYNRNLKKQFQDDALHYNLAELFFANKKYDRALENLNQVQFSDINYLLGSRILLIKTFYESGSFDPLYSALSSFSVYLSRNKQIATPLKKSCQHFCNLLHKTLLPMTEKKQSKLQIQIREVQPLAERGWLVKVFQEQLSN